MKKYIIICGLTICWIVFASFTYNPITENEIPYPEGYRKWAHVKSMIISSKEPKFEHSRGYHHIYANEKAMEGYKTGKFPNGSVIVADFIEIIEKEGSIAEGKRKFIDVMVKDTEQYKSTGGWGYEEFDADSKTIRIVTQAKAAAQCYNCHAPQESKEYIFSSYRE